MSNDTLPVYIHEAFQKKCRSAILMNYIGNRVQIWEDWASKGDQQYIYLFSVSISDDARKGLRELRKLVKADILIELERPFAQMCRFRLANKDLEQRMLREAFEYWTGLGYSTDQITEKRH